MVYCIVILMGLLTSGCISVFNSHEQQFSVSCSEQDAIIYINGEKYTNPVTVTLPRNKEVNIRVEKEGFTPYITTIPNQLSGYGLGDVITSMFLIIPVTGLLTPGAWELVETDLKVKLYKAH
jgi:hypothetical protein